jgi:glycerophosphoryl diester phosphodiesterase
MEERLLEDLAREGIESEGTGRVVVQSFSADSLRALQQRAPDIPRFLLVESDGGAAILADLSRVRALAQGIGPSKELLYADPEIVRRAHDTGLSVVPWTFRSDRPGRFANVADEMYYFLNELDVDGLFTNNPDLFPR